MNFSSDQADAPSGNQGSGSHQRWLPYTGADDDALRAMVDVCPTAAAIWRRGDGRFIHANSPLTAILAIDPTTIQSASVLDFVPDRAEHTAMLDELGRTGVIDTLESTAVRADGSAIWITSSHRPVTYDGRPAVFTVFHDVTASKSAREADTVEASRRAALAVISRVMSGSALGRAEYERLAAVTYGIALFDRIAVTTLDTTTGILGGVYVQGASLPGMNEGETQSLIGTAEAFVAATRTGLVLSDTDETEPLLRFPVLESSYAAGLRSFILAPLIANDKVLGTLNISSADPGAYTASELEFIERVAAHLAPAMERARLHEALEQEVRERQTMAAIGRVIGSSPDLSQVSERFPRLVSSLLPADRIAISVLSDDGESISDLYSTGINVPERDNAGQPVPVKRSMLEMVVNSGRSVLVNARRQDDVVRQVPHLLPAFKAGLRSFLSVPLIVDEAIVGALHLRSIRPGAYRERELALAEGIGAQIAGVIALSRLRASEKRAAEERRVLSDIAAAANQDLDLHRMFERVAEALAPVIPYDRIEVALLEPRPGPLRRVFEKSAGEPGEPSSIVIDLGPLEGSTADARNWEGRLLDAKDLAEDVVDDRFRSAVQAPLGVETRRVGHIRLMSGQDAEYSNLSLELLNKVATYVTPAVQNAVEHRQTLELAQARERVIDLDARNRELERLSEAKSRFIATVSHELKTPLTSMLAFTDILQKDRHGRLGDREVGQLEVIKRNGRRLALLIDDLLDLSGLERGDFSLTLSEFDATELFTEVHDAFQPTIETKRQTLTLKMPESPVWISADRARLTQVVSNLVSNAAKYSPENSEISLVARRRLDRMHVTIQDHGIGIPAGDQSNMFTPFFRANNEATRAESGTGLGLYIARNIIALHGGRIEIDSTEGEGTTIKFNVPGLMERPSADYLKLVETQSRTAPASRLDDLSKIAS
ncbi:MAG: ATP-binding protein [Chloroflexi bacterium]|nr:ATP-binding protein [Chloroflexota bacterium]